MKAKVKMSRMNLRMESGLADWLRRAAKLRGTGISKLVRELMRPAYEGRYRKA